MRELIDDPSLSKDPEPASRDERRSDKLAKEFVRWCFSFGSDFRNSPDVVNLRSWAHKTNLTFKDSEEGEVVAEARKLHVKRLEQMMKKSEAPMLGSPDAEEAVSA